MKKAIVLFAIMACAAVTSQGAYLYWQVSQSDMGTSYSSGSEYVGVLFAYETASGASTASAIDMGDSPSASAYKVNVTGYNENYSFYVEVYNYNSTSKSVGDSVKTLDSQTYAQLYSNGALITGTDLKAEMAKVWHGGTNYSTAPEPTSGLLMMVGLALLGLKRRKA